MFTPIASVPIAGKAKLWKSDGSGRDGYIYHNNGGFNKPEALPNHTRFYGKSLYTNIF